MNISEVIRTRRKALGLTQEQMAGMLGVTAPAVNKWENGVSMPDITMLSPLARLLQVSLETLLSHEELLSDEQIQDKIRELGTILGEQGYEAGFAWAKQQLVQYPGCEKLTLLLNTVLEQGGEEVSPVQREFILQAYERLLGSNQESMRRSAATALYTYWLREKNTRKAEQYLAYLPEQDPDTRRKRAQLCEAAGDSDMAYAAREELLMSTYQTAAGVLSDLFSMSIALKDMDRARYYCEKKQDLAELFEMGEYNAWAAQLELMQAEKNRDETITCVKGMLNHIDSVRAFAEAPLYSHMAFRDVPGGYEEQLRQNLIRAFATDEDFSYMEGDPRWEALLYGDL